MWKTDFVPCGCVKHGELIIENFKKAMDMEKISSEVFMSLINENLAIVETDE